MNRSENINRPMHPHNGASRISKMLFWWLKDIYKLGANESITEDSIYENLQEHGSSKMADKFTKLWNEELKQKSPSVIRMFHKAFGSWVIILGILYSICETSVRCAQPFFLGALITHFVGGVKEESKIKMYYYAIGIIVCSLIPVITYHPFILYIQEVGMKIRLGSAVLIYQKILKITKSSSIEGLNARVINLMSNELERFDDTLTYFHELWKTPLESLILGYLIYRQIGLAGIIGTSFIFGLMPLQIYISRKSAQYNLKTTKRVSFMNEIIQGMQIIKLFAWENSFAKSIHKVRKKEMGEVKGGNYLLALLFSIWAVARVAIFISLICYVYLGNVITAEKVFVITSYFGTMIESMVYVWPVAITKCVEGYVSCKRLKKFLLLNENKSKLKDTHRKSKSGLNRRSENIVLQNVSANRTHNLATLQPQIVLNNLTAAWVNSSGEAKMAIYEMSFKLESGELCALVGAVGSGKTSLLHAILGELEIDSGSLQVDGVISYASQEAWLFGGSIKSNILFVNDYDERRYSQVVKICALEKDFEILQHGDATVVGERGVCLSSGQRSRINLARCIYKKADIYLLDDPLSAVDTHSAKLILKQCIQNFLKNKIVILVTNQHYHLKELKNIIKLSAGKIETQEKIEVANEPQKFESFAKDFLDISTPWLPRKQSIMLSMQKPSEEKEATAYDPVSLSIYKRYFQSVGSTFLVVIILLFRAILQTVASGIDYFVSEWVNWEESADLKLQTAGIEKDREGYVIVYSVLMFTFMIIVFNSNFSFFYMCMKACQRLHDKLFDGVTGTFMSFFNKNPSGRILNRFSNDIGNIDEELPQTLFGCIRFALEFISVMILVVVVNYWYLIATAVMLILLYFVRHAYIKISRSIKRIEAMTRSPHYSHINTTLQGLSTIRASRAEKEMIDEFSEHLDVNSSVHFLLLAIVRGFSFWLDVICVLYITVITLSLIELAGKEIQVGSVGLAITQVLSLTKLCQWGMVEASDLEIKMVSVERVFEYADLPSESTKRIKEIPPKGWPANGIIEFLNVDLKYSRSGPLVLEDLSFTINPNEKIGIVGKTGAGKSSLVQALFRLTPTSGKIFIDGVDTNDLDLKELRSEMSIIPQDPILFSGTLRSNLDPFQEKTDAELWKAIEEVELKSTVQLLAGGLECKMLVGGINFSVGQRQLICLARALLRRNKILIVDEATANVDHETNNLIQETIRHKFADCTVLTIAHRLHTVINSDRVLVMDAGKIVEFDHPHELLKDNHGHFRMLVEQMDQTTANEFKKTVLDRFLYHNL